MEGVERHKDDDDDDDDDDELFLWYGRPTEGVSNRDHCQRFSPNLTILVH